MKELGTTIVEWLSEQASEFPSLQSAFLKALDRGLPLVANPHTKMKSARHYFDLYQFRNSEMGLTEADCPGMTRTLDWLGEYGDRLVLGISLECGRRAILFSDESGRIRAGFLLKEYK